MSMDFWGFYSDDRARYCMFTGAVDALWCNIAGQFAFHSRSGLSVE